MRSPLTKVARVWYHGSVAYVETHSLIFKILSNSVDGKTECFRISKNSEIAGFRKRRRSSHHCACATVSGIHSFQLKSGRRNSRENDLDEECSQRKQVIETHCFENALVWRSSWQKICSSKKTLFFYSCFKYVQLLASYPWGKRKSIKIY